MLACIDDQAIFFPKSPYLALLDRIDDSLSK